MPIVALTDEDMLAVREDLSQNKMREMPTARGSLQTYEKAILDVKGKHFAIAASKGKSKFVLYNNSYIRKTTALYWVQKGTQLSADRLLRVRAAQPKHIYTTPESRAVLDNTISSGDLCLFKEWTAHNA